jgi:hypothetical protein
MDPNIAHRNELLAQKVVKGLGSRNMEGIYAATREEALAKALALIPEGAAVAMGGCMSAHEIGLVDALKAGPYRFIDRDAMEDKRAAMLAAPINAQRFGLSTPCAKTGACADCKSPDTICCQFLVTRFSHHPGRIQVLLVNDSLGF